MKSILHIYLIEAPGGQDFYDDQLETDLIRPIAQFCDIPFTAHTVLNREYFCKALKEIRSNDDSIPVLHFAGHGNWRGIGLSDSDLITWTELRELLIPVNQRTDNALFVCMSCCEGIAAMKSALSLGKDDPYIAIVGTKGKPTIAETSVAYATFYHQLTTLCQQLFFKQQVNDRIVSIDDIIENMRAASLHEGWDFLITQEIKADFRRAWLRHIMRDR